MSIDSEGAYARGFNAALRTGEHEGFKRTPENPYSNETVESLEWEDGFGDGIDFLISLVS